MNMDVAGAKASLARTARRAALLAPLVLLAVPALSLAHPERPSYWPNPRPDPAVSPPAGGKVPTARSLASAVTGQGPGDVSVVCKGPNGSESLARLRESLNVAKSDGVPPAPQPAQDLLQRGTRQRSAPHQPRAGREVPLPRGAGGRQ